MTAGETIFRTWSVCPVCLKQVRAERVRENGRIFLRKTCTEHGYFESIIWSGFSDIDAWVNGSDPAPVDNPKCPDECGLCSDHLRDTCCVVLNVTSKCNLECQFCLAGRNELRAEPSLEEIMDSVSKLVVKDKTLLQLSGGEPTMRDDLPRIIKFAKDSGAKYVQLNSNGIRLGEDKNYTAGLAQAGLSFVFMQFDGTEDSIFEKLRGKPLLNIKKKAIDNCSEFNIGVTLVPTVVRDINLNNTGNLLRFAISRSPAVRGVHFQPVSFFGRVPKSPEETDRVTLDELIYEIDRQTEGEIKSSDLLPSCCDHPLCGFHADYVTDKGKLIPLQKKHETERGCGCGASAADKNREFVARRWQRPSLNGILNNEVPKDIHDMSYFLNRVKTQGFTVTSMAFQDAWNIDFSRLRKCSLHVYENGRKIPFCAYFLTATEK